VLLQLVTPAETGTRTCVALLALLLARQLYLLNSLVKCCFSLCLRDIDTYVHMYVGPEEHVHERLVSNIRLPTPHLSIRQHTSAYVSIRQHSNIRLPTPHLCIRQTRKHLCGILELELERSSE